MIVVMVSGRAGEGKTTFADFCITTLLEKYNRIGKKVSFAQGLKNIARQFGWDGLKSESGRTLLQMVGSIGRQYNPNIWANMALTDIQHIKKYIGADVVFIDDWRFENEGLIVSKDFDTIKARMNRQTKYHLLFGTDAYDDLSERSLPSPGDLPYNKFYDVIIHNLGNLEDLKKTAEAFCEKLNITYWR
jgi:hypothetical protein